MSSDLVLYDVFFLYFKEYIDFLLYKIIYFCYILYYFIYILYKNMLFQNSFLSIKIWEIYCFYSKKCSFYNHDSLFDKKIFPLILHYFFMLLLSIIGGHLFSKKLKKSNWIFFTIFVNFILYF